MVLLSERFLMNLFVLPPAVFHFFIALVAQPLFSILGRLKVYGRENLKGLRGGVVFAMNHSSESDPFLVAASLGPFSRLMPVFSVARERDFYKNSGIMKYVYGGFIFKLLGAYPVFMGNGDYELALKHHIKIIDAGQTLGIFPEGHITRDGKIGEAKAGVAYLLWRTGAPVVPVAFRGHWRMKPQHFFMMKHTIAVSYGKPIHRSEMFGPEADIVPPTKEELKLVAEKIMDRVREMHSRI